MSPSDRQWAEPAARRCSWTHSSGSVWPHQTPVISQGATLRRQIVHQAMRLSEQKAEPEPMSRTCTGDRCSPARNRKFFCGIESLGVRLFTEKKREKSSRHRTPLESRSDSVFRMASDRKRELHERRTAAEHRVACDAPKRKWLLRRQRQLPCRCRRLCTPQWWCGATEKWKRLQRCSIVLLPVKSGSIVQRNKAQGMAVVDAQSRAAWNC